MLRHILLIKLQPGTADARVDDFLREIAALPFPGRSNVVVGRDIGIRPGNFDLTVSNDFPDQAAYTAWTEDPGHQHVRSTYLTPIAADVARCLIEV